MKTKINVGIASYGMSGQVFHAPFVANHPNFNLYGICERNKNLSREKYPHSKLFSSVDELLQCADIELVIINTPVQTHYEYAKKALQLKKSVIVEKPFTIDVSQAEELYQLSVANGCFLSVYQNRRYDGDFLKVKEIVQSNILGNLKEVEIRFDRFRTEISPKMHKETAEKGGGAFYDLGAHLIDQAFELFGYPKKFYTDLGYFRNKTKTNDYFELILFYENELRVRLKSSTMAKERQFEYILHGSNGSFLQQRFDNQEVMLLKGIVPSLENWLERVVEPNGILHTENGRELTIAQHGNYMDFYTSVYKSITYGEKNPVSAFEIIPVMKILSEAESCKTIFFDADSFLYTNNPIL